ncbi:MAG TPA: cytochrome c3 family protein [Phycisphaerae bacterium]|nr:cytochrome c3 family protein [Phycisphaerae bacterium]
MTSIYHRAKPALLLLGGTIAVGLMFTAVACQMTSSGGKVKGKAGESPRYIALAYKQVAFDREQHGCVSGPAADAEDCANCHHAKPQSAGKACATCHSRDEGRFSKKFHAFVPKLKEAMHDPDAGCRSCHDDTTEDGLWECRHCHTALNDL